MTDERQEVRGAWIRAHSQPIQSFTRAWLINRWKLDFHYGSFFEEVQQLVRQELSQAQLHKRGALGKLEITNF